MINRGDWGSSVQPPLATPSFSGAGAVKGEGEGGGETLCSASPERRGLQLGPGGPTDSKWQGHRKAESLGSGADGLRSGGRAERREESVRMTWRSRPEEQEQSISQVKGPSV